MKERLAIAVVDDTDTDCGYNTIKRLISSLAAVRGFPPLTCGVVLWDTLLLSAGEHAKDAQSQGP